MVAMRMILFLGAIGLGQQSSGAYRVFQLQIEDTQTNKSRTVLTNLDPDQYPGYYPLPKNQKLLLLDTWMCRGRSDYFKPPCSKPK